MTLIALFLLAACSGDTDEDPGPGPAATFDCDGSTCTVGTHYCLMTYFSRTGTLPVTSECVDLPAGCSSCPCAQEDAPEQFPTSNNCDSSKTITCASFNGEVVVECR